jgi:hypothetical protein
MLISLTLPKPLASRPTQWADDGYQKEEWAIDGSQRGDLSNIHKLHDTFLHLKANQAL